MRFTIGQRSIVKKKQPIITTNEESIMARIVILGAGLGGVPWLRNEGNSRKKS